ncbi:hypothetical protein ACROYT_G040068 [Oculina patagonica]
MTDTRTYTMPDPMDFGSFVLLSHCAKCFEKCFEEDEVRVTAAMEWIKAFLNRLKPEGLKILNAIAEKSVQSLNRQYEDLIGSLRDDFIETSSGVEEYEEDNQQEEARERQRVYNKGYNAGIESTKKVAAGAA